MVKNWRASHLQRHFYKFLSSKNNKCYERKLCTDLGNNKLYVSEGEQNYY
jgi:hypothetical protein